jgi:hypothetical protein
MLPRLFALCESVNIVTDLLSALLSTDSVNNPQPRDRFYVVCDATVATQRRSKQTHLCGNWSTRNNEKFSVQSAQRLYNATLVGRQTVLKSSRVWSVPDSRGRIDIWLQDWFMCNSCVESRCWETTSEIKRNPSAWATVNCKRCKSAIALYCLYIRVTNCQ